MQEIQPVNQQVVIDITIEKKEQRTAGGIIIPDTSREKPLMAPVVAVGIMENAEVSAGDIVIFKPYSGTEIDFEGRRFLILPYADILAILVETEAL